MRESRISGWKQVEQPLEEDFGIVQRAAALAGGRSFLRQGPPPAGQFDQRRTDPDCGKVVGSDGGMAETVQFHIHPGAGSDQDRLAGADRLKEDMGGPDVVDRWMVRYDDRIGVGQQVQVIPFAQIAGEEIHVGKVLLPSRQRVGQHLGPAALDRKPHVPAQVGQRLQRLDELLDALLPPSLAEIDEMRPWIAAGGVARAGLRIADGDRQVGDSSPVSAP